MRYIKKADNAKSHELEQKQKAEKRLNQLLDNICQAVDIRTVEWDFDKELFIAIISSSHKKLERSMKSLKDYDDYYALIKELGISIDAKYRWFTNIKEHIQ